MFESLCVVCPAQRRLLENANDLVPDGILNVPWLASLDTDLITWSCQPELDANNTCTMLLVVVEPFHQAPIDGSAQKN